MKLKHTHPEYTDEQERQERLAELKRLCAAQLAAERGRAERPD
jgi:hypothetical protein